MSMDRLFPADARQRVADAVRAAEAGTAGEVVVVVVEASDDYAEASWRAAVALAGALLLVDLAYRHFAPFWLPWNADAALAAAVVAGGLGSLLPARVPGLRRLLLGRSRMAARVRRAAKAAFAAERVFETRDRTGILVFLSLLEHQVVVLPDAGIEAKAPEAAWAGVVETIVGGMRSRKPGDGLVAAVRACGDALRAAGFVARPDDTNEIADSPRFR